jgi:hypothetical protein
MPTDLEIATSPPSKDKRSALTDRLFERLAAMYGKAWFDTWADVPMADVKDAWASGLASFSPYRIKGALEACLQTCRFPPSLPEFAILCQQAPPDPADVAKPADLLRLAAPKKVYDPLPDAEKRPDCRDWARRILKRLEHGERVPLIAEQYAREALTAPGVMR